MDSISESLEGFGKEPVFSYTDRNEHASFARAGIRAVDLKMCPALFYHTDMDTVDTIESANLLDMCRLCVDILTEELPKWQELI